MSSRAERSRDPGPPLMPANKSYSSGLLEEIPSPFRGSYPLSSKAASGYCHLRAGRQRKASDLFKRQEEVPHLRAGRQRGTSVLFKRQEEISTIRGPCALSNKLLSAVRPHLRAGRQRTKPGMTNKNVRHNKRQIHAKES